MPVGKNIELLFHSVVIYSLLSGVFLGRPEGTEDPQPSPLCQGLLLLQEVLDV